MYIKMSESDYLIYYQSNEDVILSRAKDYYENDKERLWLKENMEEIDIPVCLKKRKID